MADIKAKYPASNADTTAITAGGLASLATSSSLLAGFELGPVVNTTDLDVDHLLSGFITVGTTPTASTRIEIWAFAPQKIASGTPTWPDVFDGTPSAETITSEGIKSGICKLVAVLSVDATTSNRVYGFGPVSMAGVFGGSLPPQYGLFVTHNTGVNLNATGSNHEFNYHRIQAQAA